MGFFVSKLLAGFHGFPDCSCENDGPAYLLPCAQNIQKFKWSPHACGLFGQGELVEEFSTPVKMSRPRSRTKPTSRAKTTNVCLFTLLVHLGVWAGRLQVAFLHVLFTQRPNVIETSPWK